MATPTIAIIGAGNMGLSLIGGLITDKHPANQIIATNPSSEKLAQLEQRFNIKTTTDNMAAAKTADVIIFAVKPQYIADVAKQLAPCIQEHRPLVISIAAGIKTAHLQKWLGNDIAIVRAMPNTPALIGCGATALYANDLVKTEQRNTAESMLRAVGLTLWVNKEDLMDTVTALSGSGPAYFFLMMEALQTAAEELGLPTETAKLLTLQTALGSARIAIESTHSLAELRKHVTSPGGTTEKALSILEEHQIRDIFKKTLSAAKARSEELANSLGDN